MPIRPSLPSLSTSTQPFLHCCETRHLLAEAGHIMPNRSKEQGTWNAIEGMQRDLLTPLEEPYGVVTLTSGFAGPELVTAIKMRAEEGGGARVDARLPFRLANEGGMSTTRNHFVRLAAGLAWSLRNER